MKETIRSKEEAPQDREVNLYFVRHGEQTRYKEDNAPLSLRGRVQVLERFAIPFADKLQKNGSNIVKIYSSGRPRAIESAKVIEDEVRDRVEAGILKDTTIYKTRERKGLQITDPISKMLENGSEPHMAFTDWQLTPEPILHMVFNTKSPREVAQELDQAVDELADYSEKLKDGPNINVIFVTHETVLGAMAKHHFYKRRLWVNIDFAENFRVSIHKDGKVSYHFRGMETERM